jgi:hypothetical protein
MMFWSALLIGGTLGNFKGQVVNGPNPEANKNWVFVQAAKGAVRRVEISKAKVTFASDVKQKDRVAKPEEAIREGAQVRVTASQDDDGEWNATAVEILAPAPR